MLTNRDKLYSKVTAVSVRRPGSSQSNTENKGPVLYDFFQTAWTTTTNINVPRSTTVKVLFNSGNQRSFVGLEAASDLKPIKNDWEQGNHHEHFYKSVQIKEESVPESM